MNLQDKQNSESAIKLLAAQRSLYSEAKKLYLFRIVGALVLASLSPIIFLYWPVSKLPIAFISGVWILLSRLLIKRIESQKILQAATIQEQFDTYVFELPWNDVLAGRRIRPEIVAEAGRKFTGKNVDLEDWYPDPGDIAIPLAIFLCQRSSLVWDSRLRRMYSWLVMGVTIGLIGFGFILAVITNLSLPDYLLALFFPALSALITGIEEANDNLKIASEKEEAEKKVNTLWERGKENPKAVTIDDCRRVQDLIFSLRSRGPLVPDFLYVWLKPRYQSDMKAAVLELRDQAGKSDTEQKK